jgi:hypothetical protein
MKPILALILTKQGTLQDRLLAQCFDDQVDHFSIDKSTGKNNIVSLPHTEQEEKMENKSDTLAAYTSEIECGERTGCYER